MQSLWKHIIRYLFAETTALCSTNEFKRGLLGDGTALKSTDALTLLSASMPLTMEDTGQAPCFIEFMTSLHSMVTFFM